jgi:hypothetical protein
MIKANTEFLNQLEEICQNRKNEILNTKDEITISGTTYYVSNNGDDASDGKTQKTAWKTLEKVSTANLKQGDGVLFKRGDLFRVFVMTKSGVTYGAYGEGEKPKFYGHTKNLGDESLWELYDKEHNIWKLKERILDCGTLVFNGGENHSRRLIPSYRDGKFVCRDDETKPFDIIRDMTNDLDIVWFYQDRLVENSTKGESFPVPVIDEQSFGELYLRCDKGNPAEVFSDIEAVVRGAIFKINSNHNVTIDNLCLKYACFGVSGGDNVKSLHVSNCEIGWISGNILNYFGTDPNYPQGTRGSVTRYGNAIEIYGACEDYIVSNNYIYQVYDAGITHQMTTCGKTYNMNNIRYLNNLIEYCVYSIEYFLEKTDGDTQSKISNCEMANNILRFSGYGWGQQRHNTYTPAHVKGWNYENSAENYTIHNNIFDRSAYRMLHLVAKLPESLPQMWENTYIQKLGHTLGQYGANQTAELPVLSFVENSTNYVTDIFGDKNAKVYYID